MRSRPRARTAPVHCSSRRSASRLVQRIFAARLAFHRHDAKAVRGFRAARRSGASGPASLSSRRMMRGFIAFAALFQPRQNARAGARCARLPWAASHRWRAVRRSESQLSGRASISPSPSMPVISSTAISGSSPALVRPRLALPGDGAFGFQFPQQAFEDDAVRALEAGQPRQIALGRAGMFGQQGQQAGLVEGGRAVLRGAAIIRPPRVRAFSSPWPRLSSSLRVSSPPSGAWRFLSFRLWRFALGFGRRFLFRLLAAPFGGAFGDQRQRLFQGHLHRIHAFGNGGVGVAVADIGAVTALQHLDGVAVAVLAQFLQRSAVRGGRRPWPSSRPAG